MLTVALISRKGGVGTGEIAGMVCNMGEQEKGGGCGVSMEERWFCANLIACLLFMSFAVGNCTFTARIARQRHTIASTSCCQWSEGDKASRFLLLASLRALF